jgi:TRAP-type C4-dicarboxylate transport system permease small subunit
MNPIAKKVVYMLRTFIDGLRNITKWGVIVVFATIVVVVFLQVVLRYLFQNPPCWSEEIARYCQVWLIMLASPICIRKGSHLAVDYLTGSFSPKINTLIQLIINILIFCYIPFIVIFGIKLVHIGQYQSSPALQLKMAFIYMVFPLSGTLMLLESGLKTIHLFKHFCSLGEVK